MKLQILQNTISRTSHFPTKQIAKQQSQHPKQFPLFFHRQNNFQTSKYPHIYFFKQISQSFPTSITSKTAPLGAGKLFTQLKYKTFEISICFFNINMYNSIYSSLNLTLVLLEKKVDGCRLLRKYTYKSLMMMISKICCQLLLLATRLGTRIFY